MGSSVPTGAGKSTTLKMILGLVRPTAGNIKVLGKKMDGANRLSILRQVGSLIESPSYYGHLTGEENLRIVQTLRGVPEKNIREVLQIVRLDGQRGKKVAHYSLGMKQRLGLAAALLGFPRLLILDEPTNGLDPAGIQEMRELIRSLPGRFGMTVVVSSHLLSEIDQMADHVGIIREGRLVFQDTLSALHARSCPRLALRTTDNAGAARLLGENRVPCTLETAGSPSPALRCRCSQSLPLSGLPPGGSSAHGGAAEEPGRPLSGAHRKGGEPVKLLALEFCKCRRRKLTLVCAGLLAAQLLWFGVYLTRQDAEALAQGWMLLLYNLAMVDAIMLPIGVAVIASRSCELEHRGHTLKLLETAVTPGRLYAAKLAWGALVLAGLLLVRGALFLALGLAMGFPGGTPWGRFVVFTALSWAVSMTLYALQQGLSLRFANQAVALVCGIFGSFVGLMALLFPVWVQRCVPWGYYGLLSLVRMEWDEATRWTAFFWRRPEPLDLALLCLWAALFLTVGRTLFVRKEV